MHGREGERRIHRRHMWSVPAPSTSSVAVSDSVAAITSDSLSKDGRKICVGDCALFKPPQDTPPFIGIIRRLILGKEENLSLSVNWLYRPADVKLGKGTSLEPAPNEVFYSFHKDEIPAASLLHPCKVAFLPKGVELPSGISSFVCRRVYDIENKCLWWLTDQDYINERQEEVDKLLDKTRLEMYGAVQSGGRSPKRLNGPTGTLQSRPGSESVQNSSSPLPSQVKGKKRDRADQGSDPVKRERVSRADDTDSGQSRPEHLLKSEIAKITDKGGLVDFEGVERLVQLIQPDSAEKKIDLTCRRMLVDVIADTDRLDCLGWFVQLRGLSVLDEWLQEVHKGKIGDGSSPKESDKSAEEFLLVLLRALDKLPVNLHALQTCNVGKSVNHLRSHKNSEIQKKARTLVDTWKKRVEAEMNMIDAKTGSTRGGSWPSKSVLSEVSHVGNRRNGGPSEVSVKSSSLQSSTCKIPPIKLGSGETVAKNVSTSPCSTKSAASVSFSSGASTKDPNSANLVGGSSDMHLSTIKEEKSSSSSQSQNNSQSCSSDHAKMGVSSCREDARSSTAGSVSVSKISGSTPRNRKSSNGLQGSAVSGVQKETSYGKSGFFSRNLASEKVSPTRGTYERVADVPNVDHQRLIVRLPNTGRSPARNANGGSFEDPAATLSKSSPPAQPEKLDHLDRKVKGKSDAVQAGSASNINVDLFQGGDGLVRSDEGNVSTPNAIGNEWSRTADDGGKLMEASKVIGSSSGVTPKPGKSYDASFSSINALIESCFKFSEASTTASGGDDFWMNLLASVPAGEMSRSDVSPSGSLRRNSPVLEESCSGNDVKSRHLDEDTAQTEDLNIGEANGDAILKQGNSVDSLHVGGDLGQAELEARKRAQEAEDTTILAKVSKFKESQADRPQKSIARERIRPRPKPLGEKDLGGFEPRPPPVDPLKERAYKKMEVEGVVKKKRRVKRSEEESVLKRRKDMTAEETPMAKEAGVGEIPGRVVAPEVVEVASEVVEVVPVVAEIAQEIQVEGGATGPEPRGEEQPQGGPAPQGGGGVRLTTAIYHARAVSKRLEGEEGLVRAAADRLVEIVDEAAVRSVAKFNEDELLRGLCSAQMEVTTLVGVLLRKMATAKVKSDEAKAQLANFKRDSAGWKKAARSACSRGWQEVEKAKKMQVLAIVYRNVADRAQAELIAVKLELEDERRQVVSLEFQLADEQKKLGDAQKACAVAIERHEEAMTSNEELRAQQIKEKDEADVKIAGLQKELEDERAKAMEERANLQKELEDERAKTASERASLQKELEEERTKTASERAAYPDLYVAAIEKFKGFAEFQMAIDAAVASNVAREVSGGAGPSETTAGGRTEAEVIESFQRSYLYKHEMAEFWDSGWKMFKRKAEELFPDLDLSSVKIDEDDVAQTPMDEGIEEEDLVSSEE